MGALYIDLPSCVHLVSSPEPGQFVQINPTSQNLCALVPQVPFTFTPVVAKMRISYTIYTYIKTICIEYVYVCMYVYVY